MKQDRTFWRRLAQAVALVTLMTAGLVVGVPSGAAGFGLELRTLGDVVVVPGGAIVVDPGPQQPSADLSVAIADSTDPAIAGQGFDYGVTVQNLGPDTAAGIVLNINRSDNLEIKGVSGAVECQSDFSSCSLNRIPSGGVARVVLYVYANQAGSVTASVAVDSSTADPSGDNNSASESTDIVDDQPPPSEAPRAQLNVVTHVVDDNGGTAKASNFDVVLDGVNADPSYFSGDEKGTPVELDAGDYKVSLEDGASGYSESYSDGCAGTIEANTTKTCTITLDDRRAQLMVVTHVSNKNGGTSEPADFALAVKGGSPDPAQFSGNAQGIPVALDAGDYAVSQETALGYHTTLSADCQGTIGPGDEKTCTVSNVDLAPIKLTLAADSTQVPAGGTTGYTATVTNPNPDGASVSYVSVWLPDGFAYQKGSTTGAITSDPSLDRGDNGRLYMSWEGPGDVAGGQTKSMHFGVTAPAALGDYRAGGSGNVAAPFTIDDAGTSPQITVVAPDPAPNNSPPQTQTGGGSGTPNQTPTTTTTTKTGPAPVAPPEFQQNADVEPVSGSVLIRLPGTTDFVPLTADLQVGYGAEIDATGGRVALVTVDQNGTTYRADFYEGRFVLKKQLANGVTVLWLSGSDFTSCKTVKRALSAFDQKKPKKVKRSKKVVRHLWGSGKGKFRTKGRYIAATVHGTTWLTEDRCDGTRAFVQEGVVDVRDLVKHKTIQLGAGQSYVARPH